jgi:dipeptidase E
MKLFLSSFGIPADLESEFIKLVGKKAGDIKFAQITNASDPYPLEERGFQDDVHNQFKDIGLNPEEVDLRKYTTGDNLYERLKDFDVIWCRGGNTYYLRYLIRESGFEKVIKQLIKEGKVYGGDSAGAVIMTPTIKYISLIDDPSDAPVVIEKGVGLVKFCIVPHWGYEKYEKELKNIRDLLRKDGFEVKTLTDNQAIIINDDEVKILG